MQREKHSPEQIIRKLREAEVELAKGRKTREFCRQIGVTEQTYYRWRKEYGGPRVVWKEQSEWSEWASISEGAYVLRSNASNWTVSELWQTYIQLWQAEAAFRIHKTEPGIRPIGHQKEERVQAHILVCFLAFAMWKTLEGWTKQAGLGARPRKLLDELRRLASIDVVLPLESGKEMRRRCGPRPDRAQAAHLDRMGLKLPQRLRGPDSLAAEM